MPHHLAVLGLLLLLAGCGAINTGSSANSNIPAGNTHPLSVSRGSRG